MKYEREVKVSTAKQQINFQTYGVNIGIESDGKFDVGKISCRLDDIFPNGFHIVERGKIEHQYSIIGIESEKYELYKNGQELFPLLTEENLIDYLASHLRNVVAEFAVGKVFIHAGVVGWKGKAIVIPGSSFAGKTTLVAELVKRGAVYYSDEYAVLDQNGKVYPYPKKLSIRGIIDNIRQLDIAVEQLNGKPGIKPLSVGAVLITKYKQGMRTKINIQSRGRGVLEILGHSFAFRRNPQEVLAVLSEMVKNATIFKAERGEAAEFVDFFLEYIKNE